MQQSSASEGGDSGRCNEGTAEEIQRVAGAEMMGSRGHRDNKGCEEMKMDNCGPWSVQEVQRAANSLRTNVLNTLTLLTAGLMVPAPVACMRAVTLMIREICARPKASTNVLA
jgi:hypothetical protein